MVNGNYTENDKKEIGEKLAEIFCLRKSRQLYQTTWGNKTAVGVFEMVQRFGIAIYRGDINKIHDFCGG